MSNASTPSTSTSTTPAPPNPTAVLISSLQTLIASAQADMAAAGAGAQTVTDAQQVVLRAQAVIATLQALGNGTPAYTVVVQQGTVGPESIFAIAERELGDLTLFPLILKANNMAFIALDTGQVLTIPQA